MHGAPSASNPVLPILFLPMAHLARGNAEPLETVTDDRQ